MLNLFQHLWARFLHKAVMLNLFQHLDERFFHKACPTEFISASRGTLYPQCGKKILFG